MVESHDDGIGVVLDVMLKFFVFPINLSLSCYFSHLGRTLA